MFRYGGKRKIVHQTSQKKLLLIFCLSLLHHPTLTTSDRSPIDTDDFKDFLLHTDTYVDKSLLIEEFALDKTPCKIIHRPQRWGKTLNLNMLARFFDLETYPNGTILPDELKQNRKLFTGGEFDVDGTKTKLLKALKISKNADIMKLQGQYPVLHLKLKDVNGSTFEEFERSLQTQVSKVFAKFKYLNSSKSWNSTYIRRCIQRFLANDFSSCDTSVLVSMNFLSKCLFKHFGRKVMIFVDDYDAPVLNAYYQFSRSEPGKYAEILGFIRTLYMQTFHLNEHLENSLASGTIELPLLREVNFYCLYDPKYSQFYGFHQPELNNLLANVPFIADFEKIKISYGYKFNESAFVYNPGSIMRYIARNGIFEYTWIDKNHTDIDTVLLSDDLQEQFRNLSLGRSIACCANFTDILNNFNMEAKPSDRYVILFFSGIIAPVNGRWSRSSDRYEMVAANLEIVHLLRFKVNQWKNQKVDLSRDELLSYFVYGAELFRASEKINKAARGGIEKCNTMTKMG